VGEQAQARGKRRLGAGAGGGSARAAGGAAQEARRRARASEGAQAERRLGGTSAARKRVGVDGYGCRASGGARHGLERLAAPAARHAGGRSARRVLEARLAVRARVARPGQEQAPVARVSVEARGSEPGGGNRRCRSAQSERGHREPARVWQMRAQATAQTCEPKSGVQAPSGGVGTARHGWWRPERAAGMEAGDAGARVEQRMRGGVEWALEHGCAGMIRQGRSKRGSDNRRRGVTVQGNDVQSDDVQGGGVQCMAVFPLGELRPRPSWCAGGSRVMDIRGRRGKGSGRHGPNTGRPRSSRRRRCEYGVANWKEKLRSEGDG
jgi:hypothetical protein